MRVCQRRRRPIGVVLDFGQTFSATNTGPGSAKIAGSSRVKSASSSKAMRARIAGGERQPVIGDVLGVRHRLAAGRRIDLVVQQEMVEIRRRLLGDRRQHAEAHQDVAFGIEQHQLALGLRQRQPEREPGMAAHRRIAERHVERLGVGGLVDPVAPAAPGHDDRVAAMFGEALRALRQCAS